jgi:glycosyltransferase involved in cell wall biosynthesis
VNVVAMLRVKNEARWIAECVRALVFCRHVVLFDDNSTDDTARIAQYACPVDMTVIRSPFRTLSETRDKNYLLERVRDLRPDWIVHPDADEVLTSGAVDFLLTNSDAGDVMHFRFAYVWSDDGERQLIRTDGVYGRFYQPRAFRYREGACFVSTRPAGFHCGSFPSHRYGEARHLRCEHTVMHYGYVDPKLRASKFAFYRANDPGNAREDFYRHITQGDPGGEPAAAVLKHAGPLRLESL